MGHGFPAVSESVAEDGEVRNLTRALPTALCPAAARRAQQVDPRSANIDLPGESMPVSDDTAGQVCRIDYPGRGRREGWRC
jgi:hypothetical protein